MDKEIIMKKPQAKIYQLNRARPNWRHQAFGICCRADWTNAHVFEFSSKVGGIIAYNTEHALSKHLQVEQDMQESSNNTGQEVGLFE
jgi:hypothetical protein